MHDFIADKKVPMNIQSFQQEPTDNQNQLYTKKLHEIFRPSSMTKPMGRRILITLQYALYHLDNHLLLTFKAVKLITRALHDFCL